MPVKIIGIGDLTIDILLPGLERAPEWGQEVEIAEPIQRLGGNIGNLAEAAAVLQADLTCMACIGDDKYGDFIRSRLSNIGLSTSGLKVIRRGKTSIAFAGIRTDGERFILTYPGVIRNTEQIIAENALPKGDIVFLSGWCLPPHIHKDVLIRKMAQWRDERRWVAADLIWPTENRDVESLLPEIVENLDALFLNEDELKAITGERNINLAVKIFQQLLSNKNNREQMIILKRGKQGASLILRDQVYEYSPAPATLKDTLGAGDYFNLAFLNAWWNLGLDLQRTLGYASDFVPIFIRSDRGSQLGNQEILKMMEELGY
jgi:sugar/nucleoside kinase (ribokinase family)